MLQITSGLALDDNELQIDFIRSSGPGGQNVNKVATAAQLRFDVGNSPSLSSEVKERLIRLAGSRMTADGILVIEAKRYRTQEQNRMDAVERLVELVRAALNKPRPRRATRPTQASQQRRLEHKKQHAELKRGRSRRSLPEE